jgi:hypothetical protein
MYRAAIIKEMNSSVGLWANAKRSESRGADCGTTTGHVAALLAADPDERRALGLHSLGENTRGCLLKVIELSRRGSNL